MNDSTFPIGDNGWFSFRVKEVVYKIRRDEGDSLGRTPAQILKEAKRQRWNFKLHTDGLVHIFKDGEVT